MKSAQIGRIEGALMGDLLTVVRGDSALSIPIAEASDLAAVVAELMAFAEAVVPNDAVPKTTTPGSPDIAPVTLMPNLDSTQPVPRTGGRRGKVWNAVRRTLNSTGRAQDFESLLTLIVELGLTAKNPQHALRIALGKKVAAGELRVTKEGRYALSKMGAKKTVEAINSTKTKNQRSATSSRRTGKHRPGALWEAMRTYLAGQPTGATLEAIVEAADGENWTNASSTKHAVKICLGRVGDQIEQLPEGLFRLSKPAVDTLLSKPSPPTVRVRRKKSDESSVTRITPPATTIQASEAEIALHPTLQKGNGSKFVASSHYPTPRSRQSR
jgi:hypothetical protein